jgi:hypothetical protein
MDWINSNTGAISALTTVLLTILTAVYVWLTRVLVRQNFALRDDAIKPMLSVRPVQDENLFQIFNLSIENVGGGPAQSVRLRITNPPLAEPLKHLEKNGVFKNGIALLNVREKMQFFLADTIGDLEKLCERPIQMAATFQDQARKQYESFFVVDFREFEGFIRVGEPPLVELADNSKAIKDSLNQIAGGAKLRVVASTLQDEEREGKTTRMWAKLSYLARVDQVGREEVEKLIDARIAAAKGSLTR